MYKAVKGVSDPDPYELWQSEDSLNEGVPEACDLTNDYNEHYKSSAALRQNWQALGITEVSSFIHSFIHSFIYQYMLQQPYTHM